MTTKQVVKPAELKNRDGLSKDRLNGLIKYLGRLEELDEALAALTVPINIRLPTYHTPPPPPVPQP